MALQKLLAFTEDDVTALNLALRRFVDLNIASEYHAANLEAYTPLVVFAVLRSQRVIERLTWVLVALTVVLAIFAGATVLQ